MSANTGPDLWRKAKQCIPGGNGLLSKRSERFLPELWPAYYARARGCEVWDLDGRHFWDFAQMGVGACVLGYADADVNAAVERAVRDGSMCTLNAPEEVALAERLIALHSWADMARFGRTGGEMCAAAVRLARAATGRDLVAFCGYHGWHDWYLAANLADAHSLDGQLLPGLAPAGVPAGLRGTAVPFRYNRLADLEAVVQTRGDELAAVVLEPERGSPPEPEFLQGVRRAADRAGAVLVADEVTAGLRMNPGGLHLVRGLEPDLAVFGKALGNGFPIAALVGRRAVMNAAQSTFLSSTFWTERVGFAAALATLQKFEALRAHERLVAAGERIQAGWRRLGRAHGLPVTVWGIPPLAHLAFDVDDPLAAQTLFAQAMLDQGYLAGAAVYASYAYTDEVIDGYLSAADRAFAQVAAAAAAGDVRARLRGPVLHAGFERLA